MTTASPLGNRAGGRFQGLHGASEASHRDGSRRRSDVRRASIINPHGAGPRIGSEARSPRPRPADARRSGRSPEQASNAQAPPDAGALDRLRGSDRGGGVGKDAGVSRQSRRNHFAGRGEKEPACKQRGDSVRRRVEKSADNQASSVCARPRRLSRSAGIARDAAGRTPGSVLQTPAGGPAARRSCGRSTSRSRRRHRPPSRIR